MSNSSPSSKAVAVFAKKGEASPAVVPPEEAESAHQYLLDMPIVADDRGQQVAAPRGPMVLEVHSSEGAEQGSVENRTAAEAAPATDIIRT